MKRIFLRTLTCLLCCFNLTAFSAESQKKAAPEPLVKYTTVKLTTDLGDIWIRLDREKAPITTANFLGYVDSGFYNGTIFHRVIANFMAQGGGFTDNFVRKETRQPIINESSNGLKNIRGSLAMARTADLNSATAQFFINLKHNPHLDAVLEGQYPRLGYAVFGQVVKGMDVVERIVAEPQGLYASRQFPNAPNAPVRVHSAKRATLPAMPAKSPTTAVPMAKPHPTKPLEKTKSSDKTKPSEKTHSATQSALD